jgi:hypothetical protein
MQKKAIKYGEQGEGGRRQTEMREGDEHTCGGRRWVRLELVLVLLDGAGGENDGEDNIRKQWKRFEKQEVSNDTSRMTGSVPRRNSSLPRENFSYHTKFSMELTKFREPRRNSCLPRRNSSYHTKFYIELMKFLMIHPE